VSLSYGSLDLDDDRASPASNRDLRFLLLSILCMPDSSSLFWPASLPIDHVGRAAKCCSDSRWGYESKDYSDSSVISLLDARLRMSLAVP